MRVRKNGGVVNSVSILFGQTCADVDSVSLRKRDEAIASRPWNWHCLGQGARMRPCEIEALRQQNNVCPELSALINHLLRAQEVTFWLSTFDEHLSHRNSNYSTQCHLCALIKIAPLICRLAMRRCVELRNCMSEHPKGTASYFDCIGIRRRKKRHDDQKIGVSQYFSFILRVVNGHASSARADLARVRRFSH